MSTRIVGPDGKPFPTETLRRRIGFLGGDLIADHDTASAVAPGDRELKNPHDEDDDPTVPPTFA